LGCNRLRNIADFVQKKRPFVGQLKAADLLRYRSGEGAFLVAKKLTFQQMHFFPWIAAGSTGRVDFIWLGTPDFNPSDAALSPWTVTFAQTTSGTSGTPKFNQTTVSNVMHVGGICTSGIFCSATGGNRDLADSISHLYRPRRKRCSGLDRPRECDERSHPYYLLVRHRASNPRLWEQIRAKAARVRQGLMSNENNEN